MTAPLTVILEPDHSPERRDHLQRLHAPSEGRLFVEHLPLVAAHTPDVLAEDILGALGKDHHLPAARVGRDQQWARVCAWLTASGISEVLFAGGHLFHLRAWTRLFELACVCGIDLYIIVGATQLGRRHRRWLEAWSVPVADWESFEATHALPVARQRRRSASASTRREGKLFPSVPASDFSSFLSQTSRLLAPGEYQRVRAVAVEYAKDFHALAQQYGPQTASTFEPLACERLVSYLDGCESADEGITRLRGAQIGAFHGGWSLKLDYSALYRRLQDAPLVGLTEEHAARLRRFASTHDAALGVILLMTGAPLEDLARVAIADVASNGTEVRVAGEQFAVPPYAHDLISAHRRFRELSGGVQDGPYFGTPDDPERAMTASKLRWYLRRLRMATGVNARPTVATNARLDAKRWSQRYGISIEPLTGRPATRRSRRSKSR